VFAAIEDGGKERSRDCAEGRNLGIPVDDAMLVIVVGSASEEMEAGSCLGGQDLLLQPWVKAEFKGLDRKPGTLLWSEHINCH
jgi:hypothetical protein